MKIISRKYVLYGTFIHFFFLFLITSLITNMCSMIWDERGDQSYAKVTRRRRQGGFDPISVENKVEIAMSTVPRSKAFLIDEFEVRLRHIRVLSSFVGRELSGSWAGIHFTIELISPWIENGQCIFERTSTLSNASQCFATQAISLHFCFANGKQKWSEIAWVVKCFDSTFVRMWIARLKLLCGYLHVKQK